MSETVPAHRRGRRSDDVVFFLSDCRRNSAMRLFRESRGSDSTALLWGFTNWQWVTGQLKAYASSGLVVRHSLGDVTDVAGPRGWHHCNLPVQADATVRFTKSALQLVTPSDPGPEGGGCTM